MSYDIAHRHRRALQQYDNCTAPLWLGLTKAFDVALQQAMLAAMGYLPEALPAGVAGPGPGKRKGAPLSTAAQVPHCRSNDLLKALK